MGKSDLWRTVGLGVLALASGAGAAGAAEVTGTVDVGSAYVWRGITFSKGGVAQPSLDVSGIKLGQVGLAVNVWGNFNLSSSDGRVQSGQFSEVDLALSASLPKGFRVGYIEYVFAVGGTTEPGPTEPSTRELMASWSRAMAVTPTISLYYDVEQIDDAFLLLSLARRLALSKTTGAVLTVEGGYAGKRFAQYYQGAKGGPYYFNVMGRLSYQVNDKLGVSALVGYADGFDRAVLPKQDARFYFGVSLAQGL
jgi:hypothetical protein